MLNENSTEFQQAISIALQKISQGKEDFYGKQSYQERSLAHQLFINGLENLLQLCKVPQQNPGVVKAMKEKVEQLLPEAARMKQITVEFQNQMQQQNQNQKKSKIVKIVHKQDKQDTNNNVQNKKAAEQKKKSNQDQQKKANTQKKVNQKPNEKQQIAKQNKAIQKVETKKNTQQQPEKMMIEEQKFTNNNNKFQNANQQPCQDKVENQNPQAKFLYLHMQQQISSNKGQQSQQLPQQVPLQQPQQFPQNFINNNQQKQEQKCEKDNEQTRLANQLQQAIISEKPNITWDDIAGLESAKRTLQEAVTLPIRFPQLFNSIRKPWKGILLYGPPGTGKTYLAKACATECQATFFSVTASDLISKWVGESAKLIKSLFALAREHKPSIIFIDEVDSLTGTRDDKQNDAAKGVVTEFLVQMQGVSNEDDKGLLVLGATNLPWNLDSAIRRRFEKRIYIPLPDLEAKLALIKNSLNKVDNELTDKQIQQVAQRAEGFSCADLTILMKEAAFISLRFCQQAEYFKQVDVEGQIQYMACTANDPDGYKMKLVDIPQNQLYIPPMTMNDFQEALKKTKSSVSKKDLQQYQNFTSQFGEDG